MVCNMLRRFRHISVFCIAFSFYANVEINCTEVEHKMKISHTCKWIEYVLAFTMYIIKAVRLCYMGLCIDSTSSAFKTTQYKGRSTIKTTYCTLCPRFSMEMHLRIQANSLFRPLFVGSDGGLVGEKLHAVFVHCLYTNCSEVELKMEIWSLLWRD